MKSREAILLACCGVSSEVVRGSREEVGEGGEKERWWRHAADDDVAWEEWRRRRLEYGDSARKGLEDDARFLERIDPAKVATPTLRRSSSVSVRGLGIRLNSNLLKEAGCERFICCDEAFDLACRCKQGQMPLRTPRKSVLQLTLEVTLPSNPPLCSQLHV